MKSIFAICIGLLLSISAFSQVTPPFLSNTHYKTTNFSEYYHNSYVLTEGLASTTLEWSERSATISLNIDGDFSIRYENFDIIYSKPMSEASNVIETYFENRDIGLVIYIWSTEGDIWLISIRNLLTEENILELSSKID